MSNLLLGSTIMRERKRVIQEVIREIIHNIWDINKKLEYYRNLVKLYYQKTTEHTWSSKEEREEVKAKLHKYETLIKWYKSEVKRYQSAINKLQYEEKEKRK